MSAAQVTEAHAHAAANAIGFKTVADANYWGNCSDMQKIDKIAQLIANSEARGVEAADFALQQERNIHMTTIAERDQLRAEVARLKRSRDKQLRDCVVFKQEAERNQSLWRSEQARAERAEAEVERLLREKAVVVQHGVENLRRAEKAEAGETSLRAELAKERARLDWIFSQDVRLFSDTEKADHNKTPSGWFLFWGDTPADGSWQKERYDTPRAAVDAGMKEGHK